MSTIIAAPVEALYSPFLDANPNIAAGFAAATILPRGHSVARSAQRRRHRRTDGDQFDRLLAEYRSTARRPEPAAGLWVRQHVRKRLQLDDLPDHRRRQRHRNTRAGTTPLRPSPSSPTTSSNTARSRPRIPAVTARSTSISPSRSSLRRRTAASRAASSSAIRRRKGLERQRRRAYELTQAMAAHMATPAETPDTTAPATDTPVLEALHHDAQDHFVV